MGKGEEGSGIGLIDAVGTSEIGVGVIGDWGDCLIASVGDGEAETIGGLSLLER